MKNLMLFLVVSFSSCYLTAQNFFPEVGIGLTEANYNQDYFTFTDAVKSFRWRDVATWDSLGFPASANPGKTVRGRCGIGNDGKLPNGEYVITWEGNGDITFYNSNFILVSEDLSGAIKRRVYDVITETAGVGVQINSFPVSNIKLWIPGRENSPYTWNPEYLCYLSAFKNSVIRTMDLGQTNSSPQTAWSTRTPKDWSTYVNRNNLSASYDIKGGVAYEAMVELANQMESDLWICIPHLADSIYVYNLAQLIKTGIDVNTGIQTTAPLDNDLNIWIEYSNEVWNFNFGQTHYALDSLPGVNLDEKYVFQAVKLYDIFRSSFDDDTRVVRVIGTQTAGPARTTRRLNAIDTTDYEVLAITTYFQYDYHQYIYDNWDNGNLSHDSFYLHISSQMGAGPFNLNEVGIHFGSATAYSTAAGFNKPVVTYEGNEHFNMNRKVDTDSNGVADTELATAIPASLEWMFEFCRSDFMYNLLGQYQLRHDSSGLITHVPYVAVNPWNKFGQWGFAEYLDQPMNQANKYRWLHDHFNLDYPSTCDSLSNNIDVQLQEEAIVLMPNMTSDYFEIFGKIDGYSITILDVNGVVYQTYTSTSNQLTIDITTLPVGMLFVAIENSDNQLVRIEKIIKH